MFREQAEWYLQSPEAGSVSCPFVGPWVKVGREVKKASESKDAQKTDVKGKKGGHGKAKNSKTKLSADAKVSKPKKRRSSSSEGNY